MADAIRPLFQIFESKAIASYWEDVNIHLKSPLIGSRYFPARKQVGLELAWIKGYNNLPVVLQPSAFDTKAPLRDKIGIKEISTNMPFFREAMRIGEKERQDIETLLARGQQFAQPTILKIYDDITKLIDGALLQPERMIMSLLFGGKIFMMATAENGRDVVYEYNYDVDGKWATENNLELLTSSRWLQANADTSNPIGDIEDVKIKMQETKGVNLTECLMNSTTYKGLLSSNSIKKNMNPLGYTNMLFSQKALKEHVNSETEMKFTIYDKQFIDEQGKTQKFVPDGYVCFMPGYALGSTVFGTSPSEFDLMGGGSNAASVSIINTGVAITTIKEAHPVNIVTIVEEIVMPSFERMSDIFVLKVF
jgi:hypothetical protein